MSRVVLVFLDGVGIGPDDADVNPFLRADLPVLRGFLGGRLPTLDRPNLESGGSSGATGGGGRGAAFGLDATLGVDGLPQSGTGQTTLLTGRNGAELHGSHFGPWIPVRLRPLVEQESLLRRAVDAGLPAAFANAHPREGTGPPGSRRRVAGPPLAARGAGLLTRDHTALARGDAVSSGIVNEGWRRWVGPDVVPHISAHDAGGVLARIAADHALTLYAHYATDTAGHRGGMAGAIAALERVDAFLGGLLAGLSDDAILFVVSDHGNIEDVRGGHTRNPALGLLSGPDDGAGSYPVSLLDVTPTVLRWLGVSA